MVGRSTIHTITLVDHDRWSSRVVGVGWGFPISKEGINEGGDP